MKYVAIQNIGDYKKGDEVPAELAEVWMNMYKESPVEVSGKSDKKSEVNLDLNGDGKFDEKDKSIAARVLATKRTRKKKK